MVANEKERKHRVLTILTVQRTRQDVFKHLFSVFNTKELLEGEMTLLGIWDVNDEEEGGAGMTPVLLFP